MPSSFPCSDDPAPSMKMESVLHMKEGLGETSYDRNSTLQKKSMDTVKSLVTESARDVYASLRPERFTLGDLGCSSGTNALGMVQEIVRSVVEACRGAPPPEFSVLLNDLPANDFNSIFSRLPEFTGKLKADAAAVAGDGPMVFLSGVPGSFYGRLFPSRSVHFVCSFSSLHWLSQIPPGLWDERDGPVNKGKMFISSTSPPAVAAAYSRQFRRDFSLFLRSRAAEVVAGGRMVLVMLGREDERHADRNTALLWDLLSESFAALVSQGAVEQGKVDAYDAPFYAPSIGEIEEEVRREGSFTLGYARAYETHLNGSGDAGREGRTVSMAIRAVQESMLGHHFGTGIIDALFSKYTELVTAAMEREEVKSLQIGVVLVRQ
ncbi:probable methyltransferase TCM_000336 [Oryza brachyantha]|uniref:Jasmonate O-methyltransferase n=1 Tax=Oryza brachyantha TaxID=4533 RepID=J3L386_ORYBR|nr:probable methyltransferase TCM_000336 [Oryza brachyantha]